MTNPDTATVAVPLWEVLQTSNSMVPANIVSSQELAIIDDEKALATPDSPLHIPGDQYIPSFRKWEVKDRVATAYGEDGDVFISTEPAVIEKITGAKAIPQSVLLTIDQELREEPFSPTLLVTLGGMAIGLISGQSYHDLMVSEAMSAYDMSRLLSGGVIGFVASQLGFLNDRSLLHTLAIRSQNKRDAAPNKELNELARASDATCVIPNKGTFTSDLATDVVKLLRDAENPKELLVTKVAPLVSAIMQAEVDFDAIQPEIEEIEARTKVLGKAIERDGLNLGDIAQKKKSLQAFATVSRNQLVEIHQDEQRMKGFKEKLLELSPDKLALTPELREFCDGVADAVKASYEPKFSHSANNSIDDLVKVMKTVDDEKLLPEIYEAFREKWAPTGIHIPDYETLQRQIVQKREKR